MCKKEDEILWRLFKKPLPYPHALTLMKEKVEEIRNNEAPQQVWLLEHPPTYTAGTSAKKEDLLAPHRFPIVEDAGRGGQWTYHGPGQRIIWVMLDLTHPHGQVRPRDIRSFIDALHQWLIQTLSYFGIKGFTMDKNPGIWVKKATGEIDKIASIGLRLSHWVSWHGLAVNVSPALEDFTGIIPCGIKQYGVTSMAQLGCPTTLGEFDHALKSYWPTLFGSRPKLQID